MTRNLTMNRIGLFQERFLIGDGQKLDPNVQDPSVTVFGFGRR